MAEVISMKQHGDLIRFHLSLKNASDKDINEDHNIYNFVLVRFQIKNLYSTRGRYYSIELSKDWSIRVDITSEILCTDKSIICPETWSDSICHIPEATQQHFADINVKIGIISKYSTIQKKIHEDDSHTDFQLCADDGSVAVHRLYLTVHSAVFKTMLAGQWKETAQARVELKEVTQKTLQYFKDFMYLGTLPDEDDELLPLLLLATRYLVETLIRGCMIRIMQTITAENLDSRMDFAVENQIDELKDNILEKIPGEIFASIYANKLNTMMDKKEPSSSSNE